MTTIRVKFRPSTVADKAGTIFYQVIHQRQMARINTDIHLRPQAWNKINTKDMSDDALLKLYRNKIDADLSIARNIIEAFCMNGKKFSAKDVVIRFKQITANMTGKDESKASSTMKNGQSMKGGKEISFFSFMQKCITNLLEEKRYSTATNYRYTFNNFFSFIKSENNGACITLTNITPSFMARYEAWLKSRGLKRNTQSFYMRILRAVHNHAVRQRLVQQNYPFRRVYTGIDKTRKRAVRENVITELKRLNLQIHPKLQLTKDMFLFSFATCGMPFVDMAHLKISNYRDGYIRYERSKTGQPLQVKATPFVNDTIKKYANENAPYIFPILKSHNQNDLYKQYRSALITYNRHLHQIAAMLPSKPSLTSYVSRHSWATIARDHGNATSVISKALGHTSERTTQVYLSSIEDSVVDKINEEIVECLQ